MLVSTTKRCYIDCRYNYCRVELYSPAHERNGSRIMNTQDRISADTNLGAVTLMVANMDAMVQFYTEGVGLSVLAQAGNSTTLGFGNQRVVVLEHSPLLTHAPENSAGLFHTAILYDTQADLASRLYAIATKFPGTFTGSSDHLVSEALYFDDPEGNGVELYWDRPRDAWAWDGDRVAMDTLFLDPNAYLKQHLSDETVLQPLSYATVGHVHLKVGDIATARAFYSDTLGFDVTNEYGAQALFVSAGNYHHHIGMNTWQSRGAQDRTPALGLGEVTMTLPNSDDLGALRERLTFARVNSKFDGSILTFEDPWKNEIAVSTTQ